MSAIRDGDDHGPDCLECSGWPTLDDDHGYWDSEWGCLDGEPKWGEVARAAIRAVHADAEEKP